MYQFEEDEEMPEYTSLQQMSVQHMQQKVVELNQQPHVQNARIVEWMGHPYIHIDHRNGTIETIDRNGQSRVTPIKRSTSAPSVRNPAAKRSSPATRTPAAKRPGNTSGRGGAGHSVRHQPRDRNGKWVTMFKGFQRNVKKTQKRAKKIKRVVLHPVRSKQRANRAQARERVRREFGSAYTSRTKRRKRRKPVQQRSWWRKVLGL